MPLPTKYRIYIGEPIFFKGDGLEDDEEIQNMVSQVKDRIQAMLNQGLNERKNIFF